MTAARRTLEEIEAARAKIPALDFEMFNDLLAIAQGQREEIARLRRYVRVLHEAIPELTDEMIDNACGPEIGPMHGIEAITYGMRTARRSGYRDGWSNCAYRLKQAKEIENPDRHQKVST